MTKLYLPIALVCFCCLLFGCKSNKKNYIPVSENNVHPPVYFLATGDPQFFYEELNPDRGGAINARDVMALISDDLTDGTYKGLVIAGDLSHKSQLVELERYKQSISGFEEYVYEGLGNHDFFRPEDRVPNKAGATDFGLDNISDTSSMGWREGCYAIWAYVRDKKRSVKVNDSKPNIHYSWDWEDVHFVQCNLFPGNSGTKYKAAKEPLKSYDFLKEDLETHVGNSGRPVVLIHHYGLDPFSIGKKPDGSLNVVGQWWTGPDRERYWNLLKQYNVIGIFTGHAHNCDICYLPWDGENIGEEAVGASFIPTFIAGAAKEGYFLRCFILDDKLIVKRFQKEKELHTWEVDIVRKK